MKCPQCDGQGTPSCPHCHGWGERTIFDDSKRQHREQCLACRGTGRLDEPCSKCDGKREIECPVCYGKLRVSPERARLYEIALDSVKTERRKKRIGCALAICLPVLLVAGLIVWGDMDASKESVPPSAPVSSQTDVSPNQKNTPVKQAKQPAIQETKEMSFPFEKVTGTWEYRGEDLASFDPGGEVVRLWARVTVPQNADGKISLMTAKAGTDSWSGQTDYPVRVQPYVLPKGEGTVPSLEIDSLHTLLGIGEKGGHVYLERWRAGGTSSIVELSRAENKQPAHETPQPSKPENKQPQADAFWGVKDMVSTLSQTGQLEVPKIKNVADPKAALALDDALHIFKKVDHNEALLVINAIKAAAPNFPGNPHFSGVNSDSLCAEIGPVCSPLNGGSRMLKPP